MLVYCKEKVTMEELEKVPTPDETKTHKPIPHAVLAKLVRASLLDFGYEIIDEEHGLARDGKRYFGGFSLTHPDLAGDDRVIVCGVRNSHDKGFAAAICIGTSMMVCSNMQFSSEVVLGRKHTKNIMTDLPGIIKEAVGRIAADWHTMEKRIAAYSDVTITEEEAAHIALRAIDFGAIPARDYYNVIQKWRNPEEAALDIVQVEDFNVKVGANSLWMTEADSFDGEAYETAVAIKKAELIANFGGSTLWGLYNAATHALKGSDFSKFANRTIQLQALCDSVADFSASVGEIVDESVEAGESEADESADNFTETFGPDPEGDFEG